MTSADNRKEPRFPIGVDVPVQWPSLAEPLWLPASDVSQSGIFLETAEPPPAQTKVVLGPPNALVHGRVVFVLLPDAAAKLARAPGIGVQLNEAIDPDAWLLRVAEHRAVTRTVAGADIPLPGARSSGMGDIPLPGARKEADIPLPGAREEAVDIPLPGARALEASPAPASGDPSPAIALPGASVPAIALPGASVPAIPLPGASVPAIALPGPSPPAPLEKPTQSGPVVVVETKAGEGRMAGARSHMPEKFERAVPFPTAASPSAVPAASMPRPWTPQPAPTIRAAIVPATDKRASAADAARRMARVPDATDEPAGAEVLIVATDARAGDILKAALVADEYTPLIARHGLEALALCVRRRPLLAIVPAAMPRLSAALFLLEVRAHAELSSLRVIVIDDGPPPGNDAATARWPKVPETVQAARRQIDLVAEGLRGQARPMRGKEDARELAAMIKGLATRWSNEGNDEAAVLALRYVVELTPSSHENAALLAWTLFQANAEANAAEALATLERVLRQQPAYAQGWFYKGTINKRRGKVTDGDDCLKRAIMYDANHAAARAELERVVEPSLALDSRPAPASSPKPSPKPSMAAAPAREKPKQVAPPSGGIVGFFKRLFGR